ncbi:hypothetical protein AT6N2_C3200 [Agrobacterium tumefaciens]|nr:hypothetical protein AT6N2_C3200 [Agrobacterium tumefaciens]
MEMPGRAEGGMLAQFSTIEAPPQRGSGPQPKLLSATLAAALARGHVEVAAGHRLSPIRDQILRIRQVIRPFVAHHLRCLLYDLKLAVSLDFTDQHRLGDVVVRHDGGITTRKVRHGNADDAVQNLVRIGRAGGFDGLYPGVEADIGGFHRVVGHALVVLGEGMPGLDELGIDGRIDGLEVVPGGKVANQRRGIETGKLFFTHGEGDDRNIFGLDALVGQFLVEGHVGVTIDGGNHGGLLAGRTEFLDVGHDRLPVGVTERRVVDHDVLFLDALRHQVGLQDLVGGLRIDIVRAGQNPALDAFGIGEVIDGRNGLLVGGGARVEDIARGFFTLILNRVEQDRVQLFENRQNGFTRGRRPAAENGGDLVLRNQLAGLFGEKRPVGGRIDHDSFKLLAENAALLVLLVDEHQHGIFQRGL